MRIDRTKRTTTGEGVSNAAEKTLLVNYVERKLVLAQRTEKEVMGVIGNSAKIARFYPYDGMAPFVGRNACPLHNQTRTLTLTSE